MNAPPSATEIAISQSMLRNSSVFLRKAAEEIAGHDDDRDRPFDEDRAMLVMVLIQTAVELASTAIVIEHKGLAAVMTRNLPTTEAEMRRRWEDGTIKTVPFEQSKSDARDLFGDEDFWNVIDTFQVTRNKLVHFHQPLDQAALYDLKYEATYVLIQLITALVRADEYSLPEGSRSLLGKALLDRLMAFEPYRWRVEEHAQKADPHVIACIICDLRAYSRDAEMCFGCGFNGEIQFLHCPWCKERSLYYDHLNLPDNPALEARCGKCGGDALAAHCHICDVDYVVEPGKPVACPWPDVHEDIIASNARRPSKSRP